MPSRSAHCSCSLQRWSRCRPRPSRRARRARANSQTFTDSTGEDQCARHHDDRPLERRRRPRHVQDQHQQPAALTADMSVLVLLDTDQQPRRAKRSPAAPTTRSSSAQGGRSLQVERLRLRRRAVADLGHVRLRRDGRDDPGERRPTSAAPRGSTSSRSPSRGSRRTRRATPTSRTNTLIRAGRRARRLRLSRADEAHAERQRIHGGPEAREGRKKLVASLAANESDTNGPVQAGTVACSATVAGKHLSAAAHRLANGVATCSWLVPRARRGAPSAEPSR